MPLISSSTFASWLLPLLLAGGPTPASDQTGVYAVLDKVLLVPAAGTPERVELFGRFAVAAAPLGDVYRPATHGRMVFRLPADEEKRALAVEEWRELEQVADGKTVVGFGFRYHQGDLPVHAAEAADVEPAVYPVGMGLRRVRNGQHGPLLELHCLPRILAPAADGGTVVDHDGYPPEQSVTLRAGGLLDDHASLALLFEVETKGGWIASPPRPLDEDGAATWEPRLVLEPGEVVRWRVRALREGLRRASYANGSFRVTPAKAGGDR